MNEPNVWTAESDPVRGMVLITDECGVVTAATAASSASANRIVDQLRLGALVLTAPEGVGVRRDGTMIASGTVVAELPDEWDRRVLWPEYTWAEFDTPNDDADPNYCYEVRRRPVPAPETMPARDVIRLLLDDGHGIAKLAIADDVILVRADRSSGAIAWLAERGIGREVTVERGTR